MPYYTVVHWCTPDSYIGPLVAVYCPFTSIYFIHVLSQHGAHLRLEFAHPIITRMQLWRLCHIEDHDASKLGTPRNVRYTHYFRSSITIVLESVEDDSSGILYHEYPTSMLQYDFVEFLCISHCSVGASVFDIVIRCRMLRMDIAGNGQHPWFTMG
ncbi:hypothetical protein R3P38DRAFT_3228666 [Favolaschia claudopus]|uniref:Uncharacterized protein n=1 Tax=Favolaschia claudopus TaxID=2862362 RepID=A0AAV9ZQS6_9AGAR